MTVFYCIFLRFLMQRPMASSQSLHSSFSPLAAWTCKNLQKLSLMCQSVLESKTNYRLYLNCDHFYFKKQRHIWLSICEKIRFFLEERDGNMWLKGIPDVISNLKCTDISLKTKKWYFTIVVKCSYGKEQLFCWRKDNYS